MDTDRIIERIAGGVRYEYKPMDDRSVWIRVSTIPAIFMTVQDAVNEGKLVERELKRILKKLEKELGGKEVHFGSTDNDVLINSYDRKKYVSKTSLVGVRGLDEGGRLYRFVEDNMERGDF